MARLLSLGAINVAQIRNLRGLGSERTHHKNRLFPLGKRERHGTLLSQM
jgi:hypothetical protein